MNDVESLSHTKWECKYHIVYIPKYRKKALYGALRQQLGEVLKQLAMQRESRIEGHLMRDHVHMLVSIRLSIRYRRWSGTGRERVRSTSPERLWESRETSRVKVSGLEGTLSRPWGEMRRRSASTYRNKSRKTNESIS